jgi:hypothetical protein
LVICHIFLTPGCRQKVLAWYFPSLVDDRVITGNVFKFHSKVWSATFISTTWKIVLLLFCNQWVLVLNSKMCYQTVLTFVRVLKNYCAHFVYWCKCIYSTKWLLREEVGLAEAEETFVRSWVESRTLTYNSYIFWGFKYICHAELSSSFLKLFTLCILNQYFHLIYQLNTPTIYSGMTVVSSCIKTKSTYFIHIKSSINCKSSLK